MRTRKACGVLLAVLLGACQGTAPKAPSPPRQLVGGWAIASLNVTPAVPPGLAELNPQSFVEVLYQGGGAAVMVSIATFRTEASAFEAEQKFRPRGAVTFRRATQFFSLTSSQLETPDLVRFSRTLDSAWPRNGQ